MGEAAFWGFVGASSLVVAAEVAFAFKLSRMVIGLIMAFGVGALISSVSFELVAPAMETSEVWQVALALACGSIVFFIGDRMIANMKGGELDEAETLGVYLALLLWGLLIARNAKDGFGAMLAVGVVGLLFWPAVLNVGMVLGVMPVIGVPTSVGYGASFGGITALLGMLTSCSSNVTVANIDNGFGAAYVATLINRL